MKRLREEDKKRFIDLVINAAFQFTKEPTFKLASGGLSNYYFNCKKFMLDPMGQYLIARLVYPKIKELPSVVAVGGLTLGADPIAIVTAYASILNKNKLQAFIVRKEPKDHGTKLPIEGNVKAGDHVVVVDDVITTGGSTIKAINACKDNGLVVVKAIALIDRQEKNGKENILQHVSDVEAIITKDEVMERYNEIHRTGCICCE